MNTDETHNDGTDDGRDVGDRNIGRLIGEAYDPLSVDAEFERKVEAEMLSAATARNRKRFFFSRIPTRFWMAAMILIAVNIAGIVWIHHDMTQLPPQKLRVLSALTNGDVDSTDRFTLLFDEAIARDEEIGKVIPAALFEIEPQPAGRWIWAANDKMEFQLDERLPAGRIFNIRPVKDLEFRTGRTLIGTKEFSFRTRPLRLNACRLDTLDKQHVNFELTFNQKVDPDELLKHMRAFSAPAIAVLELSALSRDVSEKIMLRCRRPSSGVLRIVLDDRLAGHGGTLALGKKVTRNIGIPATFTLTRAWVSTPSTYKNITAYVCFSAALKQSQRIPDVKVSPAVKGLMVRIGYSQLILHGEFKCGGRYRVTVPGTLLAQDGQTPSKQQSIPFSIPARRPTVRFTHRSGILTPHGNMATELTAVNVSGLNMSAWRLHANNLVGHLRGASQQYTSRSVLKKTIRLDMQRNKPKKMMVDLKSLLSHPLGVYRISAKATGKTWTSSSTLITVTDLGITTRKYSDGMEVWVTSLRTAKPVKGAKITAYSYNNQTLAVATTDRDGIARLRFSDSNPDGKVYVVTAELDGDLSYIRSGRGRWVMSDVWSGGSAWPETYDVMLYCERGVYRPGNTIHLTGIIRDAHGRTPKPFPLEVRVRRPDGKRIASIAVTPDKKNQGMFHVDVPTSSDGQTGRYGFTIAIPGSKEILGSTAALVETFVPIRLEVRASPTAERFGPKDKPSLKVSAQYLWGQAAAGLPVTVRETYRRIYFKSKLHKDYSFCRYGSTGRMESPLQKGKLDKDGRATIDLVLPKGQYPGLWRGQLTATVTEPGGRSVSANSSVVIDKLDLHIGLRLGGGRVVATGKDVTLDWVRLTGSDTPAAAGEMKFNLFRIEHDTVLKIVNGRHVWKSVTRKIRIVDQKVAADADGSITLKCDQPGQYRATLTDLKTGSDSRLHFHAYDQVRGPATLAMNRPERLEIILDRKSYAPGDKVFVLVRSPLSGTMLLTMESDRVLYRKVVQITDKSVKLELAVPKTLRYGAFITASIVRPVDPADRKWLPHRAMGMARLVLTHKANMLPLTIHSPKQARPGQRITVRIETSAPPVQPKPTTMPATTMPVATMPVTTMPVATMPVATMPVVTMPTAPVKPAVVHLWAVDEGILLTTAFRTPEPLDHFLAARRSAVAASDIFWRLMPDYVRPASMDRIGADGDEPELDALRRNPVPIKHRKPAVLWRRVVRVGPDGKASIEMTMPELTGRMRLMAVAVDCDRYGSAEKPIVITAPLLIESAWPRFAAPGDTFDVPVKFFNTTKKPITVAPKIKLTGSMKMLNSLPGKVTVNPGGNVTHWLKLRADKIGPVTVEIRAENPNAVSKALLSIRPASTPHVNTQTLCFNAGETLSVRIPNEFIPGTTRTRIEVSARPDIQLRPAIEKLIGYPYGCVEQTTSRLYAILYAPDLISADTPDDARAGYIANMINAGISRLWSMQTRSGGLAYWPSGRKPCLWGTAYATGFLLEARAAGYKVDKRFMRELAGYLDRQLATLNRQGFDDNTRALICRLLAVCNRPRAGWMAKLSEQRSSLDIAGRAHLAAAYNAVGRKDRAWAVLPEDTLKYTVATTTGGRLTNQVRQEAVLLSVLLDLDAEHPWVTKLAGRLEKSRKKGVWSSTLSNAAALAALARYQTLMSGDKSDFKGTIDTGRGKPVTFDHSETVTLKLKRLSGPFKFAAKGSGKIYVTVMTEGLARKGIVKPYDRTLQVRRRWLGQNGKPIDPKKLRVGDLVNVEITIRRPANCGTVHNVAIVDALPGGMEVENPRLATSGRGNGSSHVANRVEFLDDRVVLFASAWPAQQTFCYSLRVTTAGQFVVPAIQASCMYDPNIASLGKAGRVEIRK